MNFPKPTGQSLSNYPLNNHLDETPFLLSAMGWEIQERLWIFQLDQDGFLVSRRPFPKTFLASLYVHNVNYKGIAGKDEFFYLVTKEFIVRNPGMEYPSQFRPNF